MSQITCKCGNIYDSGFKFCPECAAQNPEFSKKQSGDPQSPKPTKKKFTKKVFGLISFTNHIII